MSNDYPCSLGLKNRGITGTEDSVKQAMRKVQLNITETDPSLPVPDMTAVQIGKNEYALTCAYLDVTGRNDPCCLCVYNSKTDLKKAGAARTKQI